LVGNWPTTYRIQSRDWTIKYVDRLKDDEADDPDDADNDLLGCCDSTQFEITISKGQSPESMKDTLAHEIMHAVYSTMTGVDHEDILAEENFVLAATTMFFEIVRNADSPWWNK
jgi:hypothetical protein